MKPLFPETFYRFFRPALKMHWQKSYPGDVFAAAQATIEPNR